MTFKHKRSSWINVKWWTINGEVTDQTDLVNYIASQTWWGSWDLQDAYDNDPLIITDNTNWSVKIRAYSGWDTEVAFEIQGDDAQKDFTVTGEGDISANWLQLTWLTDDRILATGTSGNVEALDTATYPNLTELSYLKWVTSSLAWSVTSLGAVWSSPNANGATLSSWTLNLEPASTSHPWVVTTWTQEFTGVKSFSNSLVDQSWWSGVGVSTTIDNTGNVSDFILWTQLNLEVVDNFDHNVLAWVFFTGTQSGNGDINLLWGALWSASHEGTGTTSLAIGAQWQVEANNASGTITEWVALRAQITETAGAFTTAYWLKVEDVSTSGTDYAIYTGAGDIRLGADDITLAWTDPTITTTSANDLNINPHWAWVLNLSAGSWGVSISTSSGNSDIDLSPHWSWVVTIDSVEVPTISSTNTLTNKRITPRVWTTTSSATPTINTDNVDVYVITAQAVDITSFTTNLSGTPTSEQKLRIAITGTAARAITRWSSFENGAVDLPTTTITTQRLDVGFVRNAATSKRRCMAAWPLS